MIRISVQSFAGEAPGNPISAIFNAEGGTFGRGPDNQLVIPDPRNFLSRTQAFVKSDGVRHTIVNISQANPMLLNGHPLEHQDERPLAHGDLLQIGLCTLRVDALAQAGDTIADPDESSVAQTLPATGEAVAPNESIVQASLDMTAPLEADAGTADSAAAHTSTDMPADAALRTAGDRVEHGPDALLSAFLDGAGIGDKNVAVELNPDFMRMLGTMLATAIRGTTDQIKLRALIKREVKADVTMVVLRGNNPLKFLDDSETILMQMLRKKMPGFMAPVEAMEDAFEDLYLHQIGVVAGIRALIQDVMHKADPELPAPSDVETSVLDRLIASRVKARQLDDVVARYAALQREYQNDAGAQFGRAFLEAYERETVPSASGGVNG